MKWQLRLLQVKFVLSMEFPHQIESILKVDEEGFVVCTGKNYLSLIKPHHQAQGIKLLTQIINGLGIRSAKAQGLKQVITSIERFTMTDQRIYIKINENKALGFVKVGQRNLFYRDYIGAIKELKPTCVLDIYVHQSYQRHGVGKEVFEKFLKTQNMKPQKLAIDRPSQKMIGFLRKHYGLVKYVPQNNNFVIFDRFFEKDTDSEKTQSQGQRRQKMETILNQKLQNINQPVKDAYQHKHPPLSNSKKTEIQQNLKSLNISSEVNQSQSRRVNRSQKNISSQMQKVLKEYPDDSLQQLKRQLNTNQKQQQSTSLNIIGKQQNNPKVPNLHYPWVGKNDKIGFRTTSNAYGAHYNYK